MPGKGDVLMRFNADTADYVRQCLAGRDATNTLTDSAKNTGSAFTVLGEKATKSMQGLSGTVAGVVMSMSGISSVVGMVVGSFTAGMDRMREKSDKLRESLTGVEDVLYKLNRMQDLPEIRARLAKMAEGVTTREGVEGIYKGAASHLGTRATEAQTEAAVAASMDVIRGGASPETAAGFANIFGDFRTIKGKMAGMKDADVSELSGLVQGVRPEGFSEKELKFVAKADDPLKAIDFILAAARSHENPKAVEALANSAEKQITPEELKNAKGAERKRLERLSKIPAEERVQAMLADPTLAGDSERADVALINRNLAPDAENAIATKPFTGKTAAYRELIRNDPNVAAKFALDQANVAKEKAKEKGETTAITEEAIWANYEKMMREGKISKGVFGQLLPTGAVVGIDRAISAFSNWSVDQHGPGLSGEPLLFDSDYRRAKADLEQQMHGELQNRGGGLQDLKASLDAHKEALEENTNATLRNTAAAGGANPALKNNSVGQQ